MGETGARSVRTATQYEGQGPPDGTGLSICRDEGSQCSLGTLSHGDGELDPVGDAELVQQSGDVSLDGAGADGELRGGRGFGSRVSFGLWWSLVESEVLGSSARPWGCVW